MKDIDPREIARIIVASTKPGQSYVVSRAVMERVAPIVTAIGDWHPADSIMENILGAAYEWSWREEPMTGHFIFTRRKEPTNGKVRTYVSPDRRHLFSRTSDGLYVRVHGESPKLRIIE